MEIFTLVLAAVRLGLIIYAVIAERQISKRKHDQEDVLYNLHVEANKKLNHVYEVAGSTPELGLFIDDAVEAIARYDGALAVFRRSQDFPTPEYKNKLADLKQRLRVTRRLYRQGNLQGVRLVSDTPTEETAEV